MNADSALRQPLRPIRRLSPRLPWSLLAVGAVSVVAVALGAAQAVGGHAAGTPSRQGVAIVGAVLLLVPALFSLAKRSGLSARPPSWLVAHAVAGSAGLLLVSWHALAGQLTSPPGALWALLVLLVVQGAVARLTVPARLARQFGSRTESYHLGRGPDRQAIAEIIARKRALLPRIAPGASEALFSPNLRHYLRRPLAAWRYARLAAQEARLVGARRRAGPLLSAWRRVHIAAALLFFAGLIAHVAVVTLFAGYAAAGRPIYWWHLAPWGG